jgi:hypothetical protein
MKRIVIICALLISAVSFTKAQGGGGGQQGTPEERAQRTIDGPAVASLNLTADQKAKVLPILVSYNKAQTDMMAKAQAGGDMAAVRTQMTTLAADDEKQIVALLTPDQKKAYDAALASAKERNPNAATVVIGGGRGGRGGQGGGAPAGGGR